MRSEWLLGSALLPALLILGCGDKGDDTGGGGGDGGAGDGGTAENCDGSGTLVLADEQNYVFDGQLDIQSAPTIGGGYDLDIGFTDLALDLQGHALDPTSDIQSANVVVFRYLTQADVETALATNTLNMADVSLFGGVETGGRTSLNLSEFTLLGNDIDLEQYFDEGYGTWLLTLNTGTTPGVGTRMALFLEPGAGTATQVTVQDDSTILTYTVELEALVSPKADAGVDVTLDWSDLTGDGRGGVFSDYAVDRVLVGHYTQTAAELEQSFLDLELISDEIWHFPFTSGNSLTLSSATSEEGDFPGFSSDGTWVVAMQCTTCANPAPPFLTIVEVCEEE